MALHDIQKMVMICERMLFFVFSRTGRYFFQVSQFLLLKNEEDWSSMLEKEVTASIVMKETKMQCRMRMKMRVTDLRIMKDRGDDDEDDGQDQDQLKSGS